MMDKAKLLERLAKARARADKARVDIVMLGEAGATAQTADPGAAYVRLKDAENAEQKHLREVTWLLDQLDRLDR